MNLASRGARAAARSVRRPVQARPAQRNASHGVDHGHGHGSGESALHVDGGVKEGGEKIGLGVYLSLALIPVSYLTYTIATSENNFISRIVDEYSIKSDLKLEKGALHHRMMEQAVSDRNLFKDNVIDYRGSALRYPEGLNHGSPLNVVAGEGYANMEELIQFYAKEKQNREAEDSRKKRILQEK